MFGKKNVSQGPAASGSTPLDRRMRQAVAEALDDLGYKYETRDGKTIVANFKADSRDTLLLIILFHEETDTSYPWIQTVCPLDIGEIANRPLFLEGLAYANTNNGKMGRFVLASDGKRIDYQEGTAFGGEDFGMQFARGAIQRTIAWGDEELTCLKELAEGKYSSFEEFKKAYIEC